LQSVAGVLYVHCRCVTVCCTADKDAHFFSPGTLACYRVLQVCCRCVASALPYFALQINALFSLPQVR